VDGMVLETIAYDIDQIVENSRGFHISAIIETDGGWFRRISFDDSCTIERYGIKGAMVCLAQEPDAAGIFWMF